MKRKLIIFILSLFILCIFSGCSRCPSNPMSMLDKKGTLTVRDDLSDPTATLWETYQADFCNLRPIAGAAQEGEEGDWYGVMENDAGDLMVLVNIKDAQSNEKKITWLNCEFVELIDSENDLDAKEMNCFGKKSAM